jgi:hypothetical protein
LTVINATFKRPNKWYKKFERERERERLVCTVLGSILIHELGNDQMKSYKKLNSMYVLGVYLLYSEINEDISLTRITRHLG